MFLQLIQADLQPGRVLACPLCRQPHHIPDINVATLPNNPYVLHMIRLVQAQSNQEPAASSSSSGRY